MNMTLKREIRLNFMHILKMYGFIQHPVTQIQIKIDKLIAGIKEPLLANNFFFFCRIRDKFVRHAGSDY